MKNLVALVVIAIFLNSSARNYQYCMNVVLPAQKGHLEKKHPGKVVTCECWATGWPTCTVH